MTDAQTKALVDAIARGARVLKDRDAATARKLDGTPVFFTIIGDVIVVREEHWDLFVRLVDRVGAALELRR